MRGSHRNRFRRNLSEPNAWAQILEAKWPEWADDVRRAHPELGPLMVVASGGTVTVTAVADEPWQAVWLLAAAVAPWWPGWLHPMGVACEITVGGVTVESDAEAMFDLAATIALG